MRVRTSAVAVAALLVLVASCSARSDVESAEEVSSTTTTTDTGSDDGAGGASTTTSTAPGAQRQPIPAGFDLASLPLCDSPAYTTLADWVATDLPGGWEVVSGHTGTGVERDFEMPEEWAMAEIDGERVSATFSLRQSVDRPDPPEEPQPEVVALDTVRGLPGTVESRVSRSGVATYAMWEENGSHWQASSDMSVPELAEALGPLELVRGVVSDPTGRFTQVGHVPAHTFDGYRVTNLELRHFDEEDVHDLTMYVRIDERTPGSTGVVTVVNRASGFDTAGEWFEPPGFEVLLNMHGYNSALADGSGVNLRAYSPDPNPVAAGTVESEVVGAILGALRPAGPDDAELVTSLPPLIDSENEPAVPDDFCRER